MQIFHLVGESRHFY